MTVEPPLTYLSNKEIVLALNIQIHSSEISGLCMMKCSSKNMLHLEFTGRNLLQPLDRTVESTTEAKAGLKGPA